MTTYSLFGHGLQSEFDFPELHTASNAPINWRIRQIPENPVKGPTKVLGESIHPPCITRLHQFDEGYWFEHRCTADYFVTANGSVIEVVPRPGIPMEPVRYDFLGRVMALALHAGGYLCLHGSAVQLPEGVIGFLGAKGHGKSTLASAMVRAGAPLVSDDILVLELAEQVLALPGVPRLRLRNDSMEHWRESGIPAHPAQDGKFVVSELPAEHRIQEPAPLAALYWLDPIKADGSTVPIRHDRLSPSEAISTLVSEGKIPRLLGPTETFTVLERALAVSQKVPVHRLSVPRDLGRLNQVAAQLVRWHSRQPPVLQP